MGLRLQTIHGFIHISPYHFRFLCLGLSNTHPSNFPLVFLLCACSTSNLFPTCACATLFLLGANNTLSLYSAPNSDMQNTRCLSLSGEWVRYRRLGLRRRVSTVATSRREAISYTRSPPVSMLVPSWSEWTD